MLERDRKENDERAANRALRTVLDAEIVAATPENARSRLRWSLDSSALNAEQLAEARAMVERMNGLEVLRLLRRHHSYYAGRLFEF